MGKGSQAGCGRSTGIACPHVETWLLPPGGIALARGLCARSRSTARAFRADRGGNVTLIFALAIIPIFGAVAAPVDYGRGNSARTTMQAALDATTLMISKEALDLQSGQIQQKAKAISTRSSRAATSGT